MCIFALGAAAGAASGLGTAMSVIGTLTSVVGTAAGIAQSQQNAAFQQQQADLQLQQQRQQAEIQNQELANRYAGEVAQREKDIQAYNAQLGYNTDALNKAHAEQQTKLDQARTQAAFKAQEAYAKSIGAKGSVLASGRTGQSVGLLAMDVDRQAGMQQAEQDAMVRSAADAAAVGSEVAATQATNANNDAWSKLSIAPQHPVLRGSPGGGPISTPSYNWF